MSIARDAIIDWLRTYAALIAENEAYLTQLDSAIGDADHGANMQRGMQAVVAKLPTVADKDIATILKTTGMTLVSTVGGASGPLYGTLFLQMATSAANKPELSLADWAAALESGVNGVIMRGKAQAGDKTMIDALLPAVHTLKESAANGVTIPEALQQSEQAAAQGRDSTTPMEARKGRASYLGERSIGHQDPGATSAHLLLKAAADTWK
ncbi:MAG: dihydroxyacetone kinase subunit L [Anaerolineae bacterium]|nr:dihydroxyacetone kinase subunit L [Anaerolineae bacterium]